MLSNAKHLLAGYTLSTVIPREHSDRGNLLAGYALCARGLLSTLCHPECNEGSQGLYYNPLPRRPRDSSLRSE